LNLRLFILSHYINCKDFIENKVLLFFFYDLLIYNRTAIRSGVKGFLIEPYATIHISEIEEYHNELTTNEAYKKDWSHSTIGNSVANLLANPDGINRKKIKV